MSEFDFKYELSPGEIVDCVITAVEISQQVFGPVNAKNFKDNIERFRNNGTYIRLSRLAISSDEQITSVVTEGSIFTPFSDFVLDEDEEGESIRVYNGTVMDFQTDSAELTLNVSHAIASLTLNAIGDIELERKEIIDSENPDPAAIGPVPSFSDQMALSEIRETFLAK